MGEAVANYLGCRRHPHADAHHGAGGLHGRLAGEEVARGSCLTGSGALGNAATRLETFVLSTGTYAYGGYPDLDALFQQQAVERDRSKREALLHQIQRLMQERVMHAPIFEPATLHGVGPRVEEPGVGLNPALLYFRPL